MWDLVGDFETLYPAPLALVCFFYITAFFALKKTKLKMQVLSHLLKRLSCALLAVGQERLHCYVQPHWAQRKGQPEDSPHS